MKTNRLIRLYTLIIIGILGFIQSADVCAQRGEKSFGPRLGFVSHNESAMGGLVFQYSLSKNVRLAPHACIVFRHQEEDALLVGLDVQFPIKTGPKVNIYPIAGVGYSSWTRHNVDDDRDATTHVNRMSLTAGAGVELRVKDSLKLFIEGQYVYVKHYDGAMVDVGIAFVF